jgi:ATP-binding cassette subfamily B protein
VSDAPERPKSTRGLTPLAAAGPFVRRQPGLVAGWLFALLVSSSATLVLPYAVRQMIDHGFSAADAGFIDRYFLALLGVATVLAIATALRFAFVSMLGERVVADLRRAVYDHLLALDQGFYERTRIGEIQSRLTTDTELVQTVVGSSASVAVRSLVTFVGAAALLVWTSPKLAAYAALVIPLVLLPMILFGRRVRELSRRSQDRIADVAAEASETLGAIHTIQSYVREQATAMRFATRIDALLRTARRRIGMRALLTALVIVLVFGAITAVLWVGARAVIAGEMTPGLLGQFVLYAVILAGSVGALSEVWGDVQRAAGAMERIGELLATRPAVLDPPGAKAPAARARGALRFDQVRFHYPSRHDTPALDGFTLAIEPGETIALVGPSGAGKSTVFQLLLRFFDPQEGSLSLDGHDVRALPLRWLRGAIALVPQDPVIFGTTARDNIALGRGDASDDEIEAAARAAEAEGFLREQPGGYATHLGERGVRLSGGQQQRIAIARALLKDAPVLLLDEATSALDAQSEALVQQALERLMAGRTTIVIAHRLATVLRADRIVVMDRGRVVDIGTHAELVAKGGLYAELARLQFATAATLGPAPEPHLAA